MYLPQLFFRNMEGCRQNETHISVVSSGKCLGICESFFCLQSAIPSMHLQGFGQLHSKLDRQLSTGPSSDSPPSSPSPDPERQCVTHQLQFAGFARASKLLWAALRKYIFLRGKDFTGWILTFLSTFQAISKKEWFFSFQYLGSSQMSFLSP